VTLALETLYPSHPECLVVIFDLTEPDGAAAFHRQRDALAEHTSVEALDENHAALIVWPGWVSEPGK
jgi:hypothetical protein